MSHAGLLPSHPPLHSHCIIIPQARAATQQAGGDVQAQVRIHSSFHAALFDCISRNDDYSLCVGDGCEKIAYNLQLISLFLSLFFQGALMLQGKKQEPAPTSPVASPTPAPSASKPDSSLSAAKPALPKEARLIPLNNYS